MNIFMIAHIAYRAVLSLLLPLLVLTVAVPVNAQTGAEVEAFVFSQDAEGVTQADFDLDFLRQMETHILEATRVKADEYLASIGKGAIKSKLTSQAAYMEAGTKKLMIIRISDEEGVTSVTVAGVVGNEFKRVTCIKKSPGAPPVLYGPCGQKISSTFGVKL